VERRLTLIISIASAGEVMRITSHRRDKEQQQRAGFSAAETVRLLASIQRVRFAPTSIAPTSKSGPLLPRRTSR